jgi:hypothetical protein
MSDRDKDSARNADDALRLMLHRSDELHEALLGRVKGSPSDPSPRGEAAFLMCSVSLEHAVGVRVLVANRCYTAAIGLMRLQFESLTRAMWLLYVAREAAIAKLTVPLTPSGEQSAKNLPSVTEMMDQIRQGVGEKVPAAAYEMLARFKEAQWTALNSFVHGGIHPLSRHAEGYPVSLILDVLRSSNGLSTMAGMSLALLTGDENIVGSMSRVQPEFEDCLPELLRKTGQ